MHVQRISYFAVVAFAILLAGCQNSVRNADAWNEVFDRPTGRGWTGGDGAYSVSLPASRTLWLFGDSVLGVVREGRREDLEYRFGNTIAIQQNPTAGGEPSSASIVFDWGAPSSTGWLPIFDETLASAATPESLLVARASGKPPLAWAMHGIVVGKDLLLFNTIATSGDCESCGVFNFEVHGSTLSVIAGVDRPYEQWGFRSGVGWESESRPRQAWVEPGRVDGGGVTVVFGTYVIADPERSSSLLVYGHRSEGAKRELVVARVSGVAQAADALDYSRWSYWDGQSWASKPESARGILSHSASDHSVSRIPESAGSGWAVVHASDLLDASVHVAVGGSPLGPFSERYVLRLSDCPIDGFDPKRPPLVYAVKGHPELSTEDELLISQVLVRAQAGAAEPQRESRYYVPRFLHVPWNEIMNHRQSSPDRCDMTRP
jgi:hypothetical protein